MTKKFRRRKLLTERSRQIALFNNNPRFNQLNLFRVPEFFEFYRENRFEIELEEDKSGLIIDGNKIQGFKFKNEISKGNILYVKANLVIGEWVEDFKKMNIVRIYLLNSLGEEIRFFDYDIKMNGYEFEMNYNSDSIMLPTVSYKIFD